MRINRFYPTEAVVRKDGGDVKASIEIAYQPHWHPPVEHLCQALEGVLVTRSKTDRGAEGMMFFVESLVQELAMQGSMAEVEHEIVHEVGDRHLPSHSPPRWLVPFAKANV